MEVRSREGMEVRSREGMEVGSGREYRGGRG